MIQSGLFKKNTNKTFWNEMYNKIKAVDRRFAATLKTHVATVAVKFTKQEI